MTSVATAEEFLRLSQEELHVPLRTLKMEYVEAIRSLGQETNSLMIKKLRGELLQKSTDLQGELRDDVIGQYRSIGTRHRQKLTATS